MERVALGVDIKNPRTRNKRPLPTDSLDLSVFEARRRASSAAEQGHEQGWVGVIVLHAGCCLLLRPCARHRC
jgi:hypothetical protein